MSRRSDAPDLSSKKEWLDELNLLLSPPPTLPEALDKAEDEDEDDLDDEDESSGSGGKKASGYDPSTGSYGGRPKKPSSLKGTDEAGDPLTAHHLFPWNKLRGDLNDALKDGSGTKMQKVLAFAQHIPPSGFYDDLAKSPDLRSTDFTDQVNSAAKALCWGPANIFMGPLNNKRGDDPGEKVDESRMKSGVMTPASAVADLLNQQGGITKATKLTELLARNVREAMVGDSGEVESRPYDPQDWEEDLSGKRVQRKQGKIKDGGGNISIEDDKISGWTEATKTTSGTSKKKPSAPKMTEEEIRRLREEADERRIEKEKSKEKEDTDDEDSFVGGFLFDEEL